MNKFLSSILTLTSLSLFPMEQEYKFIPISYSPESHPNIGTEEYNPHLADADRKAGDPRLYVGEKLNRWGMRELIANPALNFPDNSIGTHFIKDQPIKDHILSNANLISGKLIPLEKFYAKTTMDTAGTKILAITADHTLEIIHRKTMALTSSISLPKSCQRSRFSLQTRYYTLSTNYNDSVVAIMHTTPTDSDTGSLMHIDVIDLKQKRSIKHFELWNQYSAISGRNEYAVSWHPTSNVIIISDEKGNIKFYDVISKSKTVFKTHEISSHKEIFINATGTRIATYGTDANEDKPISKTWKYDISQKNITLWTKTGFIFDPDKHQAADLLEAVVWDKHGDQFISVMRNENKTVWSIVPFRSFDEPGMLTRNFFKQVFFNPINFVAFHWNDADDLFYLVTLGGSLIAINPYTLAIIKRVDDIFAHEKTVCDAFFVGKNLIFEFPKGIGVMPTTNLELKNYLEAKITYKQALLLYAIQESKKEHKKYGLDPESKKIFESLPQDIQNLLKSDTREKTSLSEEMQALSIA